MTCATGGIRKWLCRSGEQPDCATEGAVGPVLRGATAGERESASPPGSDRPEDLVGAHSPTGPNAPADGSRTEPPHGRGRSHSVASDAGMQMHVMSAVVMHGGAAPDAFQEVADCCATAPAGACAPRCRPSPRSPAVRREVPQGRKKITDDEDELLAFFDFPAEHWPHPRATNPIESTFATREAADEGDQGNRPPGRRAGHGLQAGRVRPGPLAGRERTPPRRSGPCRRPLRTRPPRRTPRDLAA